MAYFPTIFDAIMAILPAGFPRPWPVIAADVEGAEQKGFAADLQLSVEDWWWPKGYDNVFFGGLCVNRSFIRNIKFC